MTTLEKIKTEIEQIKPYDLPCDKRTPEHIRDMALDIIDKYAEQEQKTGTWSVDIDKTRGWDWRRFYCSECGKWQTYGMLKFCPNCGSEMLVNEDEN